MFRYTLYSCKKSSLFVTSALVLALLLSTAPSTVGSLQTTKLSTSKTITEDGRGRYDILIRPEQARSKIERTKGIVEENYLTGGMGGISIEQLQKIRAINGVDIAAPVSVLGFYTSNTGGIMMNVPKSPSQSLITSVDITNQTGLPDSYNDQYVINMVTTPSKDNPFIPNRPLDLMDSPNGYVVSFALPNTFNLLIAIDPEQEDQLTEMNGKIKSQLSSDLTYETENKETRETSASPKGAPIIPLLLNEDIHIPMQAKVGVYALQEDTSSFSNQISKLKDLSDLDPLLAKDLKTTPQQQASYDLTPLLAPLSQKAVQLNDDGHAVATESSSNSFLNISTHYQTDRLQYKEDTSSQSDLILIPYSAGKASTYRNLKEITPPVDPKSLRNHMSYDLQIVGSFHGNDIANYKLDPSPLGIYSFSNVVQVQDGNGRAVSNPLQKDMTPDTFLPVPASALTNLKAAESLKGDHPIDAIRIRVGDITKYDTAAQAKILKVAQTIQEVTGLHTDIVAGASKQNVKVSIPAVGTHPAVGTVQEVWTTLGVATHITNSVNLLSICIMAALALIVIVYSMVHTRTLFILRQNEFTILQAVGWEKRDIRKMLLLEWTFKSMIAFVLSLVVLIVLHPYISFSGYWIVSVGIQVVMIGLLLLSVLLTVNKIQDRQLKLGQRGEWKRNSVAPRSIGAMARGNFIGHLTYNVLNLVLITISGAVGFFTLNFIFAVQQNIGSTFLGEAVNASIHNSQWIVVVATLSMIVFGLLETTRSLAVSRKQEIYVLQIVGWTHGQITRMIVGEKALIFGIGFLGAAVLGFGAYRLFFEQYPWFLIGQVGIAFALMFLLLVLSTAYLRKLTAKIA